MSYITADDVESLWRALTTEESERIEALIPGIEDALRMEASKRGKDLDEMVTNGIITEDLLKLVEAGIVKRIISREESGSNDLLSQESQSALGYTWSGTYVTTGDGIISILNSDLKKLGLLRQRYGVIDFYGPCSPPEESE